MMAVHPDFKELEPFIAGLPRTFGSEGVCIYKGRNELRRFEVNGYRLVVKSYKRPNPVNRLVYGVLRPSKAERAYAYGLALRHSGFGTPRPVGFLTCRKGLLFDRSYSVSMESACPYTFRDLDKRPSGRRDEVLKAIALFTARLHEQQILHHDYSGGNILFDDLPKDIPVEIIDLNRMTFHKKVGLEEGCKNFERLPGTDDMLEIMGAAYAQARGFDPELCIGKIKHYVGKEIERRQHKTTTS